MALFGRLTGSNIAVGIDIGSHSIKVVEVIPTRQGYKINRAGSTSTPVDAIKQGVIEDRTAVAEAVDSLLRTLGITTTEVVAAVAGPTVVVRQIRLPVMPEHKLRTSITWEARNHINIPVEESTISFQILGTTVVDGVPQMDVMLVATPRELVDSRLDALEQAGLEPIAIELEPFALMRALVENNSSGELPRETVALVDIGATFTHITIVSGGLFVLSRSVTVAGNSFTNAIATALGIDAAQAEEVKRTELRTVSNEQERAQLSPTGQQASRAVEPQLEELVREIRRSFAFYDYQQGPGGSMQSAESISRIILTGGTASMTGLADCLREQLSLPVETADLFTDTHLLVPDGAAEELPSQAQMIATGVGLALREPMLGRDKGGAR